jgi:hypothetical protein
MRPRLVFVHGIGGPRRVDHERDRWTRALAEGADRAGHTAFAAELLDGKPVETVFCYYRDHFDRPQAQGGAGVPLDEAEARILVDLLTELVDAHLVATNTTAGSTTDPTTDPTAGPTADAAELSRPLIRARAQLQPAGAAQGAGDLLRRAINAATTLLSVAPLRRAGQWGSGKLLIADLAQVARYLARGESDAQGQTLDARIRAHLRAALGEGPAIVIAHSLGSVVALETLHEHTGPVPLFVTLGSPIAMRGVVWPRLVPQPPRTPEIVGRWLNFWDRDDIIVARPGLGTGVAPNAQGVRPENTRIDSDGIWVHTATKYLAKPDLAGPVAAAVGALTRGL